MIPAWHDGASDPLPFPDPATWNLVHAGSRPPVEAGLDLIIEVLDTDRWRNRPVTCTLQCGGPPSGWAAAAVARTCSDRFRAVPPSSQAGDVWRDAHAGLFPARRGVVTPELRDALAAGRPVIASATGDIPSRIAGGVTGFLSPAAHRTCLAETLEHAWERRDDGPAMGRAAATSAGGWLPAPEAAARCLASLLPLLRIPAVQTP